MQDHVDIETAARILNVSPGWVRRRVYLHEIPYRKLGRLVRFAPEDIAAISDAARVESRTAS